MAVWWHILPAVSAVWALALAVVVASRKVRSPVHQSFALGMSALALMEVGRFMAGLRPEAATLWTQVAFAGEILQPLPWLAFSVVFGRAHPTEQLRTWRVWLGATAAASLAFLGLLSAGQFLTADLTLRDSAVWFSIFRLLALTAALANLERTARSADQTQRFRMKYFLLGLGAIFAVAIFRLSQVILYSSVEQWIAPLFSTVAIIGCALMTFAVVRLRLFDVDIALSRYVVYKSVAVILVGAYLLGVGLVAQIVTSLGGPSSAYWDALIVVVSLIALAVVLLSYDVRHRVKRLISRHFFREKYDYREKWLELTERLSSKPTVESIAPALAAVLFETFWIRDTYLWLADEGERQLVLTTLHPASDALRWEPAALAALKACDAPLVLDRSPGARTPLPAGAPVEALRTLPINILVPLVVQDRLVGALGLTLPQGSPSLDDEDLDLLKTISKQAAKSLLNAQLLQQLVASKELESFHAFSTFLLHDLKNFVSMLSLLVDNMGRNFDNPVFRQDALNNLSQTVNKMKRLMERLRALAQQPPPALEAVDLSRLGRSVLEELKPSLRARVVFDPWQDVPAVRADPAQLRQVLINLVLNAEEAVDGRGEIRVSTRVDNGAVVCAVSDNGRGIPRDFLEERLFKPFATTKSGGFGVGLYQCKTIVEAHGGRVSADSRVGEGTTLWFSLPAMRNPA
jgi:putative PEP-CTERM system histidine kinase